MNDGRQMVGQMLAFDKVSLLFRVIHQRNADMT